MDALTAQTIQRLCERLEVFRLRGPIPALMAEHRVGAPPEEVPPLRGFADALPSGAVRYLPDGSRTVRSMWLSADMAAVSHFRDFCRDAGRVVLPELHAAFHLVGTGPDDPSTSWLWAVFELAERRLPGTFLRLEGDTVWRVGSNGVEVNEGAALNRDWDPLCAALAGNVGDTRYWKLADAVEASLAVLDIAEVRQRTPTPEHTPPAPASAAIRVRHSTREIDVDGALGKLEAKMRKELVRKLGSESAAAEALVGGLYSLSAEDLVPLLKRDGCKTSAKTIRRRSRRYESWGRYRKPTMQPDAASDPTQSAGRNRVRSAASARVEDAVESGDLSLRTGGRGTTRIGKTVAEKAAEDAADRFAREAGIDLPPAE